MSGYAFVPSLAGKETVAINDGCVDVVSCGLASLTRPIVVYFGPLSVAAMPAEAIALGDALIRMAHHHIAALAEYQAAQSKQAVES
jgi:hypothetical protein